MSEFPPADGLSRMSLPGSVGTGVARSRGPAVRLACGGMLAMAVGLGIGRFVYTPILPSMVEGLGFDKTGAGLIASANFLGYLLGALAAALPRLPGSRLAWLLGALACVAGTLAAMAGAQDMATLMGLRFACGIASAFVLVFGAGLVLGGLAALGAPALSAIHFGGVGLGIAVSALGISWLQSQGVGWRGQWLAAGIVAAAAWVPVALLVREHEPAPAAAGPLGGGFRNLARFPFAYGLCGFGYSVTATFLVTMARALPHAATVETVAWLCVGLAAAPSLWFWSGVGRRLGARRAMALASVVQAAGITFGVVRPDAAGVVVSGLLLGATFMGITALGFAVALGLPPDARRRVTALLTAAFGIGQIAGPTAAGVLADRTGSFLAPTLLAACALLVAAACAWPHRAGEAT